MMHGFGPPNISQIYAAKNHECTQKNSYIKIVHILTIVNQPPFEGEETFQTSV